MIKPKFTYYNYFLFLSLILIGGYLVASLFFLNRTSDSGEQAANFGRTVERTNAIIQQTYHLEGLGHGYLLTNFEDTYNEYRDQKEDLLKGYDTLRAHCEHNDMATDHAEKLNDLVTRRIAIMDDLIHLDSLHTMQNEVRMRHMDLGSSITDSIISTLKVIREVSNDYRIENQMLASNYNRNAMFILSIFGVVMLVIVFVSFNRMKIALKQNERNVQEINQINLELKSMNENLENFAYLASHDLNEPLRKIRTFGDMVRSELDRNGIDRDTVVFHVDRMQNASKRMQELINDLLTYSRISRDFKVNEAIDLNEVVKTVLNDLEIPIRENSASIQVAELPKELIADEIQMRQLFQNLISNAIKFRKADLTPEVLIKAKRISSELVTVPEVSELMATSYWQIDVQDNGIGFDEQYAEKIFAVFQRLHGRSSYLGTGIGLSICKKICENHKGFIIASSEPGEGSTFSVYLPITSQS